MPIVRIRNVPPRETLLEVLEDDLSAWRQVLEAVWKGDRRQALQAAREGNALSRRRYQQWHQEGRFTEVTIRDIQRAIEPPRAGAA